MMQNTISKEGIGKLIIYGIGGLIVIIILIIVVFAIQPIGGAIAFLAENPMVLVLGMSLVVTVIAAYVLMQWKSKVDAQKKPFLACLEAAYVNGESGGLIHSPISFSDLNKSPEYVMPNWIMPHNAWLAVGELLGPGKQYSALIEGTNLSGTVLRFWPWAMDDKYINILQKKGITLEEAFQKIQEVKKADETVKTEAPI